MILKEDTGELKQELVGTSETLLYSTNTDLINFSNARMS